MDYSGLVSEGIGLAPEDFTDETWRSIFMGIRHLVLASEVFSWPLLRHFLTEKYGPREGTLTAVNLMLSSSPRICSAIPKYRQIIEDVAQRRREASEGNLAKAPAPKGWR